MFEKFKSLLDKRSAQQKLKDGINRATEIVSATLGVKGQKVIIDQEFGEVQFSDDGVTVLKEIELKDPEEQLGVKVLLEASTKTNDKEGDGTTTTAVLANELVKNIIPDIPKAQQDIVPLDKGNGDVLKLTKEILTARDNVLAFIDAHKLEVSTDEQIENVAKISSNSDTVAKMLVQLFKKLGKDASITTVDGKSVDTTFEVVEGMSYDNGYISRMFITDPEHEESVIQNPRVLVTTDKIQDIEQIKKIAEILGEAKINDLFIICDDLTGVPLNSLIAYSAMGRIRVVATKAPGFGNQKDYLEDIATFVGATLIGSGQVVKFEELKEEHFGKAETVTVKRDKTTVVGGAGDKTLVAERVKMLKNREVDQTSEYEKDKLKERISKLSGGVGVIKVGATTEIELKHNKAKIIDAVNAVKSAMKSGIVTGGGTALLFASQELTDENGAGLVKKAIQKPFELMLVNANLDYKDIKDRTLKAGYGWGYDVELDVLGDMNTMGIIDSAGVVKAALTNAVSIALSVLGSAGAITLIRKQHDEKDETKNPADY